MHCVSQILHQTKEYLGSWSCWITTVWKTAPLFQHHFQKAICQNINKSRVAVSLLDESAVSISVCPDLCKCRFCLKLGMGEANRPASHHSLKMQPSIIHPTFIHQPFIHPPHPPCVRSTPSSYKIKFGYMTFSLCLSVFDVYPGLTQSCFKPCIIYILACSQGCSENYLTCFLMLLLRDQCQTKYYKIHVIQKQHNSTTKRWWLSCFI